jgi:Fe-S-cluster formation regulator IscX/YfhJ
MEKGIKFWLKKMQLEIEYAEYQAETPVLRSVMLEDAIKRLEEFKDDPRGALEDEIDSILVDYDDDFLNQYMLFKLTGKII